MLKIEGAKSFTAGLNQISTEESRKKALEEVKKTQADCYSRAQIAASQGNIREAASFILINGMVYSAINFAKKPIHNHLKPLEIMGAAYMNRSLQCNKRASLYEKIGDSQCAIKLRLLASAYRRQHFIVNWYQR